ncbi:methanogen output domain 1-containing protein [Shewanella sp. HL-SH8]|uniref:methanogen output domain 1-containing protein n=1 Tax=Shewanella sp. HL-SH8 TaxID=3436242 RepID=UPI003EBA91DC
MNEIKVNNIRLDHLSIPLERDTFFRSVIRGISGQLEDLIGLDEASGFISIVGQEIGNEINDSYKKELQVSKLSRDQICGVLQDLKTRIKGNFHIISVDENKVIFGNNTCPFGDKVHGRPSLCMMTSNVFGTIAAENNGYAKVTLDKTIARGDKCCHVTVYFQATDEAEEAEGREYYEGS